MIRYNLPVYIGTERKESGAIIKCHDSGVVLALHLKTVSKTQWMQVEEDYHIQDGTTAVIRVKKPDNTVVLTDEGITFEGSSIVVCSDLEQAYTAPGTCTAELSLYNPEGKRLTSATFTFEVESECVCDEDERSEDYLNILGGVVKEVNAAAASAAESAAEAEEWAKKAASGGGGGGSYIDSLTADKVTFSDGETFQQKYDSGELTGPAGVDGKDGSPGADGKDGVPGENGKDGVGIQSIERTAGDGSAGTIDTYTLTLTDGRSYDFTVYNGADGEDGKDGADGVGGGTGGANGKDGITPHIGSNGNWFLGDTDTGVKAEGVDGKDGYTPVKGVDYFDGKDGSDGKDGQNGVDGITPHIGDNDNWWIGNTDTGVKAKGEDGKDGADGSGGSGGSALDVYSTEETVVGTWIDGKPIYRKIYFGSTPSGSGSAVAIASISDLSIDHVVEIKGVVYNDTTYLPTTYWTGSTKFINVYASDGNIKVGVSGYGGYSVCATICYTKTTDEATVSTTALMDAYEEGVNEA